MEKLMDKKTLLPVALLVPAFLCVMVGVPMVGSTFPILVAETLPARLVALFFAPIVFGGLFFATAAALSLPFQAAIVPGKFPRLLTHFVYGPRRLYGLCWGAVFYNTPVYYALMSVPGLRTLLLRGFGYRGHADVNIAPDAWIRDLPLLKFDQGVYVANKATVGTNICLADGSVLVDSVTLARKAMVGHLTMLAPGASIGEQGDIGVGCAIGIRVRFGSGSRIGPTGTINHGAQVGQRVEIGTFSYVGVKARIADGVKLPAGSNIPEGAEIASQEDVARHLSSETRLLQEETAKLKQVFGLRVGGTDAKLAAAGVAPGE